MTILSLNNFIDCNGNCNGGIELEVAGNSTYSYEIGVVQNFDGIFSNLCSGDYEVNVEDIVSGCLTVIPFEVIEPDELELLFEITPNCGESQDIVGSIDLTVIGGVSPYEILWSNGSTIEDQVNVTGSLDVTVVDANGCDIFQSVDVPDLTPQPGFTTNANGCIYDFMNTSVISPYGSSVYSWSIDGQFVSNTYNLTQITLDPSDAHSVCLTIVTSWTDPFTGNLFTCNEVNCMQIGPCLPVNCENNVSADFVFTEIGNGVYEFEYTGNSSNGVLQSIEWDFGDGSFSNSLTEINTYNSSGIFTVCVLVIYELDDGTLCEKQVCQEIINCPESPQGQPCANVNFIAFQLPGSSTVTFNSYVAPQTVQVIDYSWHFGYNGAAGSGASPTHIFPTLSFGQSIIYDVTLFLTVLTESGEECVICITKSVKLIYKGSGPKKLEFNVVPNPTEGKFSIRCSDLSSIQGIKITDSQGKEVNAKIFYTERNDIDIDISNFESGLYFVTIETIHGEIVNKKIVKL